MSIFAILFGSVIACSEKDTDTSTPISTEETGGETGEESGETGETAVEGNSVTVTNNSVTSADCDMDEFPEDVLTIEVVEGVVQFWADRSRYDVITSYDFTSVWSLRDSRCVAFSKLNHTGFIYAS